MSKGLLFLHTRELCYYSGSYFLQQMQQAVSRLGVKSEYRCLGEDASELECLLSCDYDGVVDLNSKLPYFVLEDDRRFLDVLDAPFYNYIVDHPLYHHPGLVFPLKDYHAIAIDKKHQSYMRACYPHLQDVSYLPLGATRSRQSQTLHEEREIPLLFLGTYEPEEEMRQKFRGLCQSYFRESVGADVFELGMHLLEEMRAGKWEDGRHYEVPMEEALGKILRQEDLEEGRYGTNEFPVLMNYLYLVDKYLRNERRSQILSKVADWKISLVIRGEGWEKMRFSDASHVTIQKPVAIEHIYDLLANTRCLLDVNPLFPEGVHDRVTSGLINGCLCYSDMSPKADERLKEGEHIFYYDHQELEGLRDKLMTVSVEQQKQMAEQGRLCGDRWYSWDAHADQLLKIMRQK